ncbi:hypothetical protein [Pseudomonas sp. PDM22]|uniref:hypothetical protein n=1 Tax=Pseudomonas sp. PDM22 TaxID=2769287 RepID=UPI00177A9E13|nr:hypothetical protein [Pseudomonas sp. PDM22]MBD9513314.1 hypothetical protein [Pseudomonas sp. PDM22]
MPTLYILAALFFITPAVLAICARLAESNGFITPDGKLDQRVKTKEVFLSAGIIASLYCLFLLTGYGRLAGIIPPSLIIANIATLIVSSISLSALVFRAFWIYQKASFLINVAITIITLWITWYAGSLAINYVSKNTQLSASEFPSAVGGLTLLYAPVLWSLLASLVSLPLYVISGAVVVFQSNKKEAGVEQSKSSLTWISLFLGLAFSFTISVEVLARLSTTTPFKNLETWILVTSGYPLSEHKCTTKKSPKDSFVILSTGEIGTAIYDGRSYSYGKVKCPASD